MGFLLVIFLILIFLGLIFFKRKLTKRGFTLNRKYIKFIRILFLFTLCLIAILIIISSKDLRLRGKDSTFIIFCLNAFAIILLYLFDNFRNIFIRYFVTITVYTLSGTIIINIFLLTMTNYWVVLYDDNNYRVEQSLKGLIAPKTCPELYVKNGLIEKKYKSNNEFLVYGQIDSVKIHSFNDSLELVFCYRDISLENRYEEHVKFKK
jgi:hypothetical protein